MAPKFEDNVILTKTERLMMSNRPKNPANARNKNVLIVGGSGSGKTRFWLKPNLLQMHSSYVVTDPKGSIVIECGNALLKNNYNIKIFNTINFKKSMHYNPMAYIHSEKDILKLVTTLIANGRMIEIYLMVSLAPIPFSTFANREQNQIGQNYLRSLFALGFQGFLIIICVGIYAVLVQSLAFTDDIIADIWGIMGYTVLLCFTLFKTGTLAKSVFNAH